MADGKTAPTNGDGTPNPGDLPEALHALAVPHTLMSENVGANAIKSGGLFLVGTIIFSFVRFFNSGVAGSGPVVISFVFFMAFVAMAVAALVAFTHRDFSRVQIDLFRMSSLLMAGLIIAALLVGLISLGSPPANWFSDLGLTWLGELIAYALASALAFGLVAFWTRSRDQARWKGVENKWWWFGFYCAVNVGMLFIVVNAQLP